MVWHVVPWYLIGRDSKGGALTREWPSAQQKGLLLALWGHFPPLDCSGLSYSHRAKLSHKGFHGSCGDLIFCVASTLLGHLQLWIGVSPGSTPVPLIALSTSEVATVPVEVPSKSPCEVGEAVLTVGSYTWY